MGKKFYITNGVTHDGFGSRIQRCISVICLTYYLRDLGYPVEYIHTPFNYIGLGEDYKSGEIERISNGNDYPYSDNGYVGYMERATKWDNYLNFKGVTINNLDIDDDKIINDTDPLMGYYRLSSDILNKKCDGNLYVIKMPHKEYDNGFIDINNFQIYRKEIISNFDLGKNYMGDKKLVAVHIRRKDAINYDSRYLPDSYYLSILDELNKMRDIYDIEIYTQRVGFDANLYEGYNIFYDDTHEDFESFNNLIFADHLITGKSSFSYGAALLNNNIVAHHGTGHISLSNWISTDEYLNLIRK